MHDDAGEGESTLEKRVTRGLILSDLVVLVPRSQDHQRSRRHDSHPNPSRIISGFPSFRIVCISLISHEYAIITSYILVQSHMIYT